MKKLVSAALLGCFALANPAAAYSASAPIAVQDAKDNAQALTGAIEKAKTTLAIDSNYWNQFDYSSYQSPYGQRWTLNWQHSGNDDTLRVEIDQDGAVYSYSYYRSQTNQGFAQLRRTQAQATADAFLRQVLPEYAAEFTLTDNQRGSDGTFSFTYQQYRDGVAVRDGLATIAVNKYDGQVESYYLGSGAEIKGEALPAKSGAISQKDALAALEKQIGVELVYRVNYDYQDQTNTIYPLYRLKNDGQVIDALSGQAVDIARGFSAYARNMATAEAAADGASAAKSLSPEEQKAVESLAGLKTKAQADQHVRNLLGNDLQSPVLISAQLSQNHEKHYVWHLRYTDSQEKNSANATVDAATGQVLSFYQYYDSQNETAEGKADYAAIAQAFLQKAAPQQLKASRLVPQDGEANPQYFSYQRMVGEIPFVDNGLSLSLDADGTISSYSLNWHFDAQFPSVSKALSEKEIIARMAEEADYQLLYINGDEANSLIYDFADKAAMQFDPFTGERLNWRGEPYQAASVPSYHWQGAHANIEYAEKLRENGIYLDESDLSVTAQTTQAQFLTLLYRAYSPYDVITDTEQLYDVLTNRQIITSGEAAPTAVITRQEAAKYLVRFLNYDKLAQKPALFNYPFDDQVDPSYQGYVALAAGLDLLTATDKAINAQDPLLLMDAFYAVYQGLNQ